MLKFKPEAPKPAKAAPRRPKRTDLTLSGRAVLAQAPADTPIGKFVEVRADRPKRYRGAEKGVLVGVRLQPELLARLDRYAKHLTRPEAIRQILDEGLA